uniref:Uncharacterized protein n=1 Tax=Rhizophora mucronata TaxID=61149 RepID=A0A2P2PTG7_RHIMU
MSRDYKSIRTMLCLQHTTTDNYN